MSDSEARYRAIVESQEEMVCRFRPEGTILFVNGAYARARGTTPEALIGENFWAFVAEEDRPGVRAMLERLTPQSPAIHIENRFETAEGERWTLWANRALAFDERGRVLEAQSSGIDITGRRRMEQALRASEERYRRVLGLMPAAVYTCDANGVITYYNEQAAILWGRAPKLGDTDERFCGSLRLRAPDGKPMRHEDTPMAAAVREGRACRNQDVVIERPDGTCISVLVNIDPLRDADGRLAGAINVFHDTTALKQAQDGLREADRRKDEFLATLSHELRNPLAPLRSSLELLRLARQDGTSVPSARIAQVHEMMERQVNHLVRLVDDLLEVSRISRGSFELRREWVQLAVVVRNALETSDPLLRTARHEVQSSLPEEPLWLHGDPVRLAQILSNLLNNAARYTDPGGRVAVVVQREAGAVAIAVRDTGAGIAPEVLAHVFEMFGRDSRTRSRASGGLGIGLALSRRLAEMHGGTLEAASEGPGRGSVFTLRLPLADLPAPYVSSPARIEQRRPGLLKRILVVDDNRDAASSLGMLLERLGAEVRIEHDGAAAVEAFRIFRPAVVLLDVAMPGVDGYEVARRIRAYFPQPRAAIVALTGLGQERDQDEARAAGFDHHLVKPAQLEALRSLLASLPDQPLPHQAA